MIKLTILLLYLVTAGMLFSGQTRPGRNESNTVQNIALLLGLVAVVTHTAVLAHALFGGAGLNLPISNIAALVGWQLGVFAVVIAAWPRMRGLGALLMPVAGATALLVLAAGTGETSQSGWQVESHIYLSLLSYGALTIAAILALLMVMQERALRMHQPVFVTRILPSLEAMEQVLFFCIGLGFFLLTLSIFSGLAFVEDFLAQHLAHKTALSLLAWLIFGTLLFGRWRFGWRGPTAVKWTLGGFVALLLAYFGSRMVLELILGRQWG